ncbi:MAG: ankyrin repeat domain-containing protein [Elusimicrobia bacterium]|nr:ankyrin repeat domain-containing protein [Elusimicrobiota bacterium]
MKKLMILCAAAFVICACGKKEEPKTVEKPKVVFALFSGYRCPGCMVFEEEFLNNFKKTYKEKYGGRVELKEYKVDTPLYITPDSPEYKEAKEIAQRNSVISRATGKLYNKKWIGGMPYAVIGATSLDGANDDLDVTGPNIERAIKKAIDNNEITRLADGVSGKMQDYADIDRAVKAGDYKAVEEFLKTGADINKVALDDVGYDVPLASAAWVGDIKMVELLLSHGADVNMESPGGWVPLGGAVFAGNREIVELLLAKGSVMPGDILTSSGVIDENMVALLKKHGADINGKLSDGNTPLTSVLIFKEKSYGPQIAIRYAQVLINQGADVNKKVTIKDDKGKTVTKTPLQLAQSREMKDFLISKGAK